jgi:hypothetical protein
LVPVLADRTREQIRVAIGYTLRAVFLSTADSGDSASVVDETSRLKVQGIALQRRNAELEEENATLKAQIDEPDTINTTTTNNKNDSKLTAVGAD